MKTTSHIGSHTPDLIGTDEEGNALYILPDDHDVFGGCYLNEDGLVVVPKGEAYDVRPRGAS